jgi:LAS superfamily LD-carboxypeptidase LdcB
VTRKTKNILIFSLIPLIAVLIASLAGYFYWRLYQQNLDLQKQKQELEKTLTLTKDNLASTTADLLAEQTKRMEIEGQVNNIASKVTVLDKLSKTDKELLQKYSKIYFLNEHYVPDNLATITPSLVYKLNNPEQIHAGVWPYLQKMMAAASSSNASLEIISAYRSFKEQKSLKSQYLVTYGSGANKFSADQGYSEHQLGTTIDFTTPELSLKYEKFDKTEAFNWLNNNAYKYGFIMSYTHDNTFYQYEPWHWRFVGVKLATKLFEEKKAFYDLPQREIDQYLINIFD